MLRQVQSIDLDNRGLQFKRDVVNLFQNFPDYKKNYLVLFVIGTLENQYIEFLFDCSCFIYHLKSLMCSTDTTLIQL